MPHFPENKLPRVLLIGDSITRGYSGAVDKLLDGKAYVFRLADSHFLNDPMLMTEIAMVLDNQKFDVVHFNNACHGWQYSEDDYRKYFPGFLDVIRKHAGHAKLIWATTTPLKVDNQAAPAAPCPRTHASQLAMPLPSSSLLLTAFPWTISMRSSPVIRSITTTTPSISTTKE